MTTLTMSQKERTKLEVMHRLQRGELSRRAASELLELSIRQIYRIYRRWRAQGDRGVVHRSRGGHSEHHYPLAIRNKVLLLYKDGYSDYGPSLFSEVLEEQHGYHIHRETLRRWLLDASLWKREVSGRKRSKHRRARPRRAEVGAMLQLDGSPHNWFEGRNPDLMEISLLVLIDDASNRTMLHFSRTENTQGTFELLHKYFTQYGLPSTIYTDHGTVYWTDGGQTQFQRAVKEFGIHVIYANSPQAKGRVERANKTHQDRLVKAMRQQGISTIEAANTYLQEVYTAKHNQRYAKVNGLPDVHRTVTSQALDRTLAVEDERKVHNDYTVTIANVHWQIEKPLRKDSEPDLSPGATVKVRSYLDGSLHIFAGERELRTTLVIEREGTGEQRNKITGRPKNATPAKVRQLISKRVQENFSLSAAAAAAALNELAQQATTETQYHTETNDIFNEPIPTDILNAL